MKKSLVRGFTLLELLIVIAIIGLLTSITLGAVTVARQKARDAKRMDDLHQVAVSLESYFNEHNNTYPSTNGAWWGTCSDYGLHDVTGSNGWVPNLAPTDMPVLPKEPLQTATFACYLYRSDGHDYKLLAHQTVEYGCPLQQTSAFYDPIRPGQCTYQISTPGGAGW